MIDLFGLRKHEEPPPPHAKSGEKRLWAVLLVLDTVILFVFAGAVASSVWSLWGKSFSAPHPVQVARTPPRKIPPQNAAKPAPTPVAAPAPAQSQTSPKTAVPNAVPGAPAKKSAAASRRSKHESAEAPSGSASKLPLGSPSVLAPNLPRREAEAAGDAEKPAAAPAASGDKPKAKSVEFICHAKEAQEVLLKGPFLVRTGGVKKMTPESDGTWHLTVSLLPGTYKYRCVIDGMKFKIESIDVP